MRLLARLEQVPTDAPPFERLKMGLDAYLEYVRGHGRAYATLMKNNGVIAFFPNVDADNSNNYFQSFGDTGRNQIHVAHG